MQVSLDELKAKLLEENLKEMFRQAYEQGVNDAKRITSFPPVLKREHLKDIFQIEMSTVEKIVRRKDFPKLETIQARYPRDKVFAWINENSTYVTENTNFYKRNIS